RNPANGETLKISASNRVSFSVGASLKSAVNK
ncbi:MAG: HU family DNA-binding protein, partial [Methylotenera sp.]